MNEESAFAAMVVILSVIGMFATYAIGTVSGYRRGVCDARAAQTKETERDDADWWKGD